MKTTNQRVEATCVVEFLIVNPDTDQQEWTYYESISVQASTIPDLVQQAHLHVGRPERHENVSAIRLSGTMTLMHHEKDTYHDHEDTVKLDLHILRERTIPIHPPATAIRN